MAKKIIKIYLHCKQLNIEKFSFYLAIFFFDILIAQFFFIFKNFQTSSQNRLLLHFETCANKAFQN